MILSDDEELFYKKVKSLLDKATLNSKTSLLKFLDLKKQEILKYVVGNNAYLYLSGGYNDAEYKKAIISPFELNDPDFKISVLKIDYNTKYLTLNHRKVLACLLDLGIKREVIGDIILSNNDVIFFASSEMKDYIIENLRSISHVPVSIIEYSGEINKIDNFSYEKIYLNSLRLDAIISHTYKIARDKAQDLVKNDMVKVNQGSILNVNHIVKEEDIISVRGKGRFKVSKILGNSRSDKIIVDVAKYI